MADGELAAAFKTLVHDVAEAAEKIIKSVAGFTEKTAENEEANLARTLDAETRNTNDIAAIDRRPPRVEEPSLSSAGGPQAAGAHVPPAYQPDLATKIPPWGTKGQKTTGLLDSNGTQHELTSGMAGPARELPKPRPGMNGRIVSHVEAHAAALMRQEGMDSATLYINRIPCPSVRGSQGCEDMLPRMLPPGARLTVWGPDGYGASFIGTRE